MALPKHNGFIRLIYFVAILIMFGFFGWLIQASLTSEQPYTSAGTNTSQQPTTKSLTPKTAYVSDGAVIVGIESRIDLSADVQHQLDQSWQEFAQQDLASALTAKDPLRVFAVYHSYNQKKNQISVTLGYPAPKNFKLNGRIHAVSVDPGQYIVLPHRYVLDSWAKANQFVNQLKFKGDYEIYLLTPDYQIDQFTAYMAIQ
ncbi:effector binding domain-containing protein [Neptunomonas japonica]|uniref:effector binding domain-containing protein n=1 Tax=Neptunomonas japonica TaxID=417574 RepID=UPI00042884A0|nr:effector binding domain-containing protein [Neptunomonas japonica]